MCSMQPFIQTVHTGVSNEVPGYVQIQFTSVPIEELGG
jgi:hypothetical protein